MTRRAFLKTSLASLVLAGGAAGAVQDTHRLGVTSVKLPSALGVRYVVFGDFHFKGDDAFAGEVISEINRQKPDFVCFVGDLVEEARFQERALDYIREIRSPVYGVPGNHDYDSECDFGVNRKAFEATGGRWLLDQVVTSGKTVQICGAGSRDLEFARPSTAPHRLLLAHYPLTSAHAFPGEFSVIFAGHTHGGQVRVPFLGALVLPQSAGTYDYGLFETTAGKLFVTRGVGTRLIDYRLNCPPEIVVVEM